MAFLNLNSVGGTSFAELVTGGAVDTFNNTTWESGNGVACGVMASDASTRWWALYVKGSHNVAMMKSTDTGTTWFEMDAAHRPTAGTSTNHHKSLGNITSVINSTSSVINVIYFGTGSTVQASVFDLTSNTWGAAVDSGFGFPTNGGTTTTTTTWTVTGTQTIGTQAYPLSGYVDATQITCGLSSGTVYAMWNSFDAVAVVNDSSKVYGATFDGSWGALTTLAGTASDGLLWSGLGIVGDGGGNVHCFYSMNYCGQGADISINFTLDTNGNQTSAGLTINNGGTGFGTQAADVTSGTGGAAGGVPLSWPSLPPARSNIIGWASVPGGPLTSVFWTQIYRGIVSANGPVSPGSPTAAEIGGSPENCMLMHSLWGGTATALATYTRTATNSCSIVVGTPKSSNGRITMAYSVPNIDNVGKGNKVYTLRGSDGSSPSWEIVDTNIEAKLVSSATPATADITCVGGIDNLVFSYWSGSNATALTTWAVMTSSDIGVAWSASTDIGTLTDANPAGWSFEPDTFCLFNPQGGLGFGMGWGSIWGMAYYEVGGGPPPAVLSGWICQYTKRHNAPGH